MLDCSFKVTLEKLLVCQSNNMMYVKMCVKTVYVSKRKSVLRFL